MKIRQPKRWCPDCKMMVFSLDHGHGRSEGEEVIGMTEAADFKRAHAESVEHVATMAIKAKAEGMAIFDERLKSAVERKGK